MLARSLVAQGRFDMEEVRKGYCYWLDSGPFDVGNTIWSGLAGRHSPGSQANGAMMRISPLGIFGVNYRLEEVAEWAKQDAAITHIHPVCQQANALFAMAITHAVGTGCGAARTLFAGGRVGGGDERARKSEGDHHGRGRLTARRLR